MDSISSGFGQVTLAHAVIVKVRGYFFVFHWISKKLGRVYSEVPNFLFSSVLKEKHTNFFSGEKVKVATKKRLL